MVRHNGQYSWFEGSEDRSAYRSARPVVRLIRYNGEHYQFEGTEEGAGLTIRTAGGSGVRIVRHNGQQDRLEGSKDWPA